MMLAKYIAFSSFEPTFERDSLPIEIVGMLERIIKEIVCSMNEGNMCPENMSCSGVSKVEFISGYLLAQT